MTEKLSKEEKIALKTKELRESLERDYVWKELHISIGGEPKAWQRHRARIGKDGKYLSMYDPNTSSKKIFRDYIEEAMAVNGVSMIRDTAIYFRMESYKKAPKSVKDYELPLYEEGILRPLTKPDVDNYAKLFMDAANNVLWDDDKLIVSEGCDKFYSEHPRVIFHLRFREKKCDSKV